MCGIFGYIKPEPKKFDFTTFCTLGIHNDTRGKDSVGVFIDGKVEYFCKGKNNSYFEEFMETSELIQKTDICTVAYGHCRAASVGAVNVETAQPVVIKDNNGKVEFVVMHNGTIYNYEELAKKYIPNFDCKGKTDSQVMAHIFYYKGYDVLKEYNGGAVFAIIDYRTEEPTYLFWKGASQKYSYAATKAEEERPLFLALNKETKDLVFSSIDTFLYSLCRYSEVYTLTPNVLVQFKDGCLYNVGEYDREGQYQSDQSYKRNYSSNNTNSTTHSTPTYVSSTDNAYVVGSATDGKCKKGSSLLHGNYKISDFGRFVTESGYASNDMWFWNGTLLKNQKAFMYLEKFREELSITIAELDDWYKELILFLSPYPFMRVKEGTIEIVQEVKSPLGGFAYTGTMYYPFIKNEYHYINGIYQNMKMEDVSASLESWRIHKDDDLDIETLSNF